MGGFDRPLRAIQGMKPAARFLLVVSAISLALNATVPLAEYLTVARAESDLWLWVAGCSAVPIMLAATAMAIGGLILLFWSRTRRAAALVVLASVLYVAIGDALLYLGASIRMKAFARLAERSRPLVLAIRTFEKDLGRPPASLDDLVPRYLRSVPPTGIRAYPTYEYVTGPTARIHYHGNPWALSVSAPSGGLNWDRFLYYPKQNYPEEGHGGWLERVGDWAYVHE